MNASKLKTIALGLVFLGLLALVVQQQLRIKQLTREAADLRQQLEESAELREEIERVRSSLRSANQRSQSDFQELLHLRNQAAQSRLVEQENVRLRMERDRIAEGKQRAGAEPLRPDEPQDEANSPERKFERAKGFFGRDLGRALIHAAQANGGVFPAELSGPLFEIVESLSGAPEYEFRARQFERVYQGSMRDVKDASQIILAREKEPVRGADGQWKRLYILADGSSQWIAADSLDGFAARERQFWPGHFIPR